MTCPSTQLRLAPITTGLVRRNPRILLSGPHQPTLVRYLEGWPKRWNGSRTFLIQFAQDGKDLARFPSYCPARRSMTAAWAVACTCSTPATACCSAATPCTPCWPAATPARPWN